MIVPMAIEFPLDVNGQFSGQIPATNGTDCTPNGWAWKVSERVPGGREYYILADKDGGAIDLATAAPLVELPDVGDAVQGRGPAGRRGPRSGRPTGPAGRLAPPARKGPRRHQRNWRLGPKGVPATPARKVRPAQQAPRDRPARLARPGQRVQPATA